MELQHRERLLRRITDDLRVGRTRRQRRLALTGSADGSSGDGIPTERLLRSMVAGSVACQFAKMLGLPLAGPARMW
jgi:hypothetical protein